MMEYYLNRDDYEESFNAVSRGIISNPDSGLLHYRMAILYLIQREDNIGMMYLEKPCNSILKDMSTSWSFSTTSKWITNK